MKKSFVFLFVILILGFASAVEFDFENVNCNDFLKFEGEIVGQEIPSQIPYSDEVFNLYISEEIFGSISIQESILVGIGCEENENATYNIYIESLGVLKDLSEVEGEFIGAFNEKLSSDEIRIEGVSFGKKVKLFFTKLALKIAGWFS